MGSRRPSLPPQAEHMLPAALAQSRERGLSLTSCGSGHSLTVLGLSFPSDNKISSRHCISPCVPPGLEVLSVAEVGASRPLLLHRGLFPVHVCWAWPSTRTNRSHRGDLPWTWPGFVSCVLRDPRQCLSYSWAPPHMRVGGAASVPRAEYHGS